MGLIPHSARSSVFKSVLDTDNVVKRTCGGYNVEDRKRQKEFIIYMTD
jgi:hypothetical protein